MSLGFALLTAVMSRGFVKPASVMFPDFAQSNSVISRGFAQPTSLMSPCFACHFLPASVMSPNLRPSTSTLTLDFKPSKDLDYHLLFGFSSD